MDNTYFSNELDDASSYETDSENSDIDSDDIDDNNSVDDNSLDDNNSFIKLEYPPPPGKKYLQLLA